MNIEYMRKLSGAFISEAEEKAIGDVIKAGEDYGYGNMMAWLATAWAVKLRDANNFKEKDAIDFVSNRGPYPLPRKRRSK